jgi:hypothetical protein
MWQNLYITKSLSYQKEITPKNVKMTPAVTGNYCTHLAGFLGGRHVALGSVQYTHSTVYSRAIEVLCRMAGVTSKLLYWSNNSSKKRFLMSFYGVDMWPFLLRHSSKHQTLRQQCL